MARCRCWGFQVRPFWDWLLLFCGWRRCPSWLRSWCACWRCTVGPGSPWRNPAWRESCRCRSALAPLPKIWQTQVHRRCDSTRLGESCACSSSSYNLSWWYFTRPSYTRRDRLSYSHHHSALSYAPANPDATAHILILFRAWSPSWIWFSFAWSCSGCTPSSTKSGLFCGCQSAYGRAHTSIWGRYRSINSECRD